MTTPDPLPAETLRDIREKAERATLARAERESSTEGVALINLFVAEDALQDALDEETVLRLVDELERLRAENEKHEEYINELLSRQAYPGP